MSEPTTENTEETAPVTEAAPIPTVEGNRRARILGSKLAEESVTIPEWNDTILIREMPGAQRAAVLQASRKADGTRDVAQFYADIVIASAFDPDTRTPIFEITDRDALLATGGKALERVSMVATRLSGLTEDAMKEDVKN